MQNGSNRLNLVFTSLCSAHLQVRSTSGVCVLVRDVSQNNKQNYGGPTTDQPYKSNMVFCLETVSSHQEQFAKRDRLISSTNWCIYQLILPENVYFLFLEQKMYVFFEVISCSFFWVVASEKQWEVCAGD